MGVKEAAAFIVEAQLSLVGAPEGGSICPQLLQVQELPDVPALFLAPSALGFAERISRQNSRACKRAVGLTR